MSTSWRTAPLPPGWHKLRLQILERDGYRCQGIRHGGKPCPFKATEVDHIDGAENHVPGNLQSLCRTCHGRKTQEESRRAREAKISRPKETHPLG